MLDQKYDFKKTEDGMYDFWLEGGFFEAGDKTKEPFTIVIPPPNVTGKLHIGHAFDNSLQDIIIRRKRMQGYDALYLPGCDHAGIATQAKIDERLKSQGVSRYDIGREEFMKVAYSWKEEYANIIHSQWKALGLSLDYSRERFTLDKGLNEAVNYVFISLYKKGYIYRGERIINWDCEAKTALSNIEVEHIDTKGYFYYFKYPFVNEDGGLIIATTRPETMFADQALMVNPKDDRYKEVIGKFVYIPGTDIKIPVIADEYVDIEFGTGVVKVTPAHDPNDFEVGKRHNLAMPLCMNEDGTMNHMAHKYEGMDRFSCREALINDLTSEGLFIKKEEIIHSVGFSERTHVMVEPRLSKQWFVDMKVLAKQVLDNKEYRFIPDRFKDTLVRWLTDIQDWCISRQLWWGHRIPAWYKDDLVVVQVENPGEGYKQDEDVLDTWFSSALWPFSTLGFPHETDDLNRYYPTNVMVTGYDIIFFWVSRMLFQGIEFTHKAPFKDILIHGLVRATDGRKMSKSLNNGIDPFDVCNKYGADALRYFLTTNSAPGFDFRYDEIKVASSANYLNKIWNISRYVMLSIGDDFKYVGINKDELNIPSKWILSKLNKIIKEYDSFMDKYEFTEASKVLYNFVWDTFASWYLEISKVDLQSKTSVYKDSTKNVLVYVLKAILKMLHPFVPFITEKIYQELPHQHKSISISNWPKINDEFDFNEDEIKINDFIELVTTIRNIRAVNNKPISQPIDIYIYSSDETYLKGTEEYIEKFVNPENLFFLIKDNLKQKEFHITVLPKSKIYIPINELVDKEEVMKKLLEDKKRLEGELKRSEGILNNQSFIAKAPKEKVDIEKEKYEKYKKQYEEILNSINNLN